VRVEASPGGDPNLLLVLLTAVGAIGAGMFLELGVPQLPSDGQRWSMIARALSSLPGWLSAPEMPSAPTGPMLLWLVWLVLVAVLGLRLLVALGGGDVGYAHTWPSLAGAALRRLVLAAGLLVVVGIPGVWLPILRLPAPSWLVAPGDIVVRLLIVVGWIWLAWSFGLVLVRTFVLATSTSAPSSARHVAAIGVREHDERRALLALVVGLAATFWVLLAIVGPPRTPRLPDVLPDRAEILVQLQSAAPSWVCLSTCLVLAPGASGCTWRSRSPFGYWWRLR
jgi:hypothetical protein